MSCKVFKVAGERFIQPQIAPPEASDQVSEPFMSKLVSKDGSNEDFAIQVCVGWVVQKISFSEMENFKYVRNIY